MRVFALLLLCSLLVSCESPQCQPGHHEWRMTFNGGFFHIEACNICHKVRQTGEE